MKYELENHTKMEPDGPLLWGFPHQPYYEHGGQVGKPADDRSAAHHPGQRSRRLPHRALQGVSSEVSVSTVADSSAIDRNPDARQTHRAGGAAAIPPTPLACPRRRRRPAVLKPVADPSNPP
jgi:hypothetical protein